MSRQLLLYVAVSVVLSIASSLITPVMPFFILGLGVEMKIYGLLNAVAGGLGLIVRIPFSALIPVVGYFKMYSLGAFFLASSRALYLAACLGVAPVYAFAAGYVLSMLRFQLARSARPSILARLTGRKSRGTVLGLTSMLTMGASALAPPIGSLIYEAAGRQLAPVFTASLAVTLAPLALLVPLARDDIRPARGAPLREFVFQVRLIPMLFRNRVFRAAMAAFMLDAFAWGVAEPYTSIYLAERLHAESMELATLSMVTTGVGALGLAAAGFASDRLGKRKLFLVASEICGIFYFLIYLTAESLEPIYAAAALMGFVIGFWGPVASAYVTEKAELLPGDVVPMAVGLWGFLTALARIPGNVIGGYLYDTNPAFLFGASTGLVALALILIIVLVEE